VLGVGKGLVAWYSLWEFGATKGTDRKVVTLGFRNQWQYPDRWYGKVCQRLGLAVQIHETSSAAKARVHLDHALDDGIPTLAFEGGETVGGVGDRFPPSPSLRSGTPPFRGRDGPCTSSHDGARVLPRGRFRLY